MKVSLEWISDYIDLPVDLAPAELAHNLTLKTVEVENVIDMGLPLRHAVVGRIVAHAADSSSTCDIGQGNLISLRADLPVGMPLVVRNGEVCTAADLGLQELFPEGPIDMSALAAEPGMPLAQVLGYNDTVLEIDNKSLTNRPDLWGHYGIARELAVIYGLALKPLATAKRPREVESLVGAVDDALCQRLALVQFALPSENPVAPLWMRSRLARIGEKSINLSVDLSNYVMFTVGQPTHAYDAQRITLPLSVARTDGTTKLDLLTALSHELPAGTPAIRDATGPVAVAGIMGGSDSAVTDTTRKLVLEIATFRPRPIRQASQQLAIRTEASARFEKALDTQRVDVAIDLFLTLLRQVAPNATVSGMQDSVIDPTTPSQVEVDLAFLDARIGQAFDPQQIQETLRSLGFTATRMESRLEITAPTWRSTGDISLPHDIVEEVARIHGYDNIPIAPLTVALKPARSLKARPLDRVLRELLANRGAMQEVVTYPWSADHLLAVAGFDKEQTVRFEGAPAPDLDSLRPSLVPNLLEAVSANLRYRPAFRLFEVGAVFAPGPQQTRMLTAMLVGTDGADLFREAKGLFEMLRRHGHLLGLGYGDVDWPVWTDLSARIGLTADGKAAGVLGLLTKRSLRAAGIEGIQVACLDLDLTKLRAATSRDNGYEAVPELPEADFDLSVVVADEHPWTAVEAAALRSHELIHRVHYVGEFRGSWVPNGHRSVTLRLTLRPRGSTLTNDVIAAARSDALAALAQQLGATLRQ